jgi:glycosyltransferase involved in cell wall biosynthesis
MFNFIRYCFIAVINNYEISLHGTARDYKYLGLILVIFNKIAGVKYNCRKFAGNFDKEFLAMPRFWRNVVVMMLLKSRMNYFETKKLVKYFSRYNDQTFWLPNYRRASSHITAEEFSGKYVFIGHVKKEKGLEQILALGNLLPHNYSVDIYGPLIDYSADQFSSREIRYCGIVDSVDVTKTLAKYNALILPTYHDGEGYPGVIIEAFSVGLPVVTTDWLSLSEIVDDACGVLIQPKNTKSLLEGMLVVEKNYNRLRMGAIEQFKRFDRDLIIPPYLAALGVGKSDD